MSDINELILELDLSHLGNYKHLGKLINSANRHYLHAIKSHNSGDTHGFLKAAHQHRQLEHAIHSSLGSDNFLKGSKHVQSRMLNSRNYLNDLSSRTSGW